MAGSAIEDPGSFRSGWPAAFFVLAPTVVAVEMQEGKATPFEKPLFPGYVFCRFDPNQRLPILDDRIRHHPVGVGDKRVDRRAELRGLPPRLSDDDAAVVAGATAPRAVALRTRNRPVSRSSCSSNVTVTGPTNA